MNLKVRQSVEWEKPDQNMLESCVNKISDKADDWLSGDHRIGQRITKEHEQASATRRDEVSQA